jgi:hypothetical protein
MARGISNTRKRLVIDACVCRSAGTRNSGNMLSRKCFDILDIVYNMNYHFVCTPEIKEEINKYVLNEEPDEKGKKNISYTAAGWFRLMVSSQRIFSPRPNSTNNAMRREIQKIDLKKSIKDAILNDIHLIEAANITDNKIISTDTSAYNNLRMIANQCDKVKVVVWMDVNNPDYDTVVWLRMGARDLKKRRLGYGLSDN